MGKTNTISKINNPSSKSGLRKQKIFNEAAKLFKEVGYQATSMRDIAQAVGIEPSSLYSHIKSKDELLQKICFDCGVHFTEGLLDIRSQEISPIKKIEALIGMHIQIAKEDPTSMTVFNDEWKHLKDDQLTQFKKLRKNYEQNFIQIINRAIEQGELRSLNPKLILHTILSSIRWVQLGIGRKEKWAVEELQKQISEILLKGIIKSHQS